MIAVSAAAVRGVFGNKVLPHFWWRGHLFAVASRKSPARIAPNGAKALSRDCSNLKKDGRLT
jgi:hypothetical protein